MLTYLSIEGLAIVDSLKVEFGVGFNVITGETGAGKSILIKALSLLLGAKASGDSVRKGYEQAMVAGKFHLPADHDALKLLAELGVPPASDLDHRDLIIRRQLTAKGRTNAWINDVPVTTASLKRLSQCLIDVFGQHDSQRLLDTTLHTHYLDQFLDDKSLRQAVHDAWLNAHDSLNKIRQFHESLVINGRDLDYLQFKIKELKDFSPSETDYVSAQDKCLKARSVMVITSALQKANEALEDQDGVSISQRLKSIAKALSSARISQLDELAQTATSLASSVDDLSFDIGKAASFVEISEDDLEAAESRLAGYQAFFRKHNCVAIEDLLLEWRKLDEQLQSIENATSNLLSMLKDLASNIKALHQTSLKLSEAREKAINKICQAVEAELQDLAMPSARFSVQLTEVSRHIPAASFQHYGDEAQKLWDGCLQSWSKVSSEGSEQAEFYLASNAGEATLPLARVASGGEVSRIMLALKKALTVGADTCVLVFDEIDTGISGRIADTVGRKIAELANFCQIICISHLPQVAAYADQHFVVEKKQHDSRTESHLRLLKQDERLIETARLISGNQLTEASRQHAQNLILEAKKHRGLHDKKGVEKLRGPALAAATRKSKSHPGAAQK
jgi:DNA repair protein RecN (Recombination protein N)